MGSSAIAPPVHSNRRAKNGEKSIFQSSFIQCKPVHTCDKFQNGIMEVFLSFPGGFRKMYRIYKNILHSFPEDLKILVKSDIF